MDERPELEKPWDLRERTMQFALAVMWFCRTLRGGEGRHVREQLFRAGTAVAANYRSATRRKSTADLISKLGTVVEEADECEFWLTFSARAELVNEQTTTALRQEANELVAIFTRGKKTAEARRAEEKQKRAAERRRAAEERKKKRT